MTRPPARTALAVLAALALAAGVAGCGGDDAAPPAPAASAPEPAPPATAPATTAPATTAPATTAPAPRPAPARPAPLPGLPADTAGFERWTRLNADPIPPDSAASQRVGFDAHRGTKNVYVNVPPGRIGASGPGRFPDGTIVVKAAGSGGDPTLVAIMRKVQGSDPAHGDWRFVEYKRGGSGEAFATNDGLRDATCWSCHMAAEQTDWVFTALDPR